jgi:hypothetical protein
MYKMKLNKLFILLLFGASLLMSCGKPNDPESLKPIEPIDLSGGYKIVNRLPTSGYAQDVVKNDSLLYIAQGEGGLLIVNVADPKNPQTVSVTTENARGYSVKVDFKDSVVFLAAGDFGVTAINVGNPYEPFVTVSNLDMKPARNIHVMGNYLFAAISEQGIRICEISYPTEPDIRGGVSTNGYAYGLTTSADSNYLFVACGEMGLSIFDISDFQEGYGIYRQLVWCDTPGYAESVDVLDSESLAFLACGTSGLQIVDYSDTTNTRIVGSYDSIGYAKDLRYYNHRIYMATELGGFQVIDVSDVTNPFLVGFLKTEYALGLAMDTKYIYVADKVEGLIVISFPN